ncbi:MAG TPA: transporter [Alphaproteobacteria bacterium]|nr:transporter [Alphaproteobacteria bacterium]
MIKKNSFYLIKPIILSLSLQAHAVQYITEDAETTEADHIEFNPSIYETNIKAFNFLEVPSLETNAGIFTDFQGHLITYGALFTPRGGPRAYGYGDTELGIKYRFIHETELLPQIAFYPKVTLATGSGRRGTGYGGPTEAPALWFLKTIGSWKISGGGGYTLIQAPRTSNYAFGGLLLQWEAIKDFTLGSEFYAQGRSLNNYGSTAILTFGATYNFTKTFALQLSVGNNVVGARTLVASVGLDWIWGFEKEREKKKSSESQSPGSKQTESKSSGLKSSD